MLRHARESTGVLQASAGSAARRVSRTSPDCAGLESTVRRYKVGSHQKRSLTTKLVDGVVNNPHACVCKSTLAQGTRVGGFEGGLVAKERLLVFGQLAGQHDSTKQLFKKTNLAFCNPEMA